MSIWSNDSDSDEEYNKDYNEEFNMPIEDIDPIFMQNLIDIKHGLYEETVFAPKLGTPDAQNVKILDLYLNKINVLYLLCKDAQRGLSSANNADNINNALVSFSTSSSESIKKLLDWIADYFTKNMVSDTLPYGEWLNDQLHTYPYIQTSKIIYD